MKAVGRAAMGVALVGLVLSLVLVVGGYLKRDDSLRSLGLIAVVGLFIVAMPAILIRKQLSETVPERGATRALYSGCPIWMKRAGYTLMALGAVIFYASIISTKSVSGTTAAPNFIPSSALGGFGLMVYSACFNQLYSLLHRSDGLSAAG